MKRILVTGADGFIGAHICKQLLEASRPIRASVRDVNSSQCEFLKGADVFGIAGTDVELIQLDLDQDAGWEAAMENIDAVIHAASPLPKGMAYLKDRSIIPTAVDGTLRCLKAAQGRVRRVVMTSSVAAVMYPNGRGNDPLRHDLPPLSEDDWSQGDSAEIGAYHVSKTLAERAAWDYVSSLPDGQTLELVTINPSIVVGPLLTPWRSSSVEPLFLIASGKQKVVPNCPLIAPVVDVRDVAAAHIIGLSHDGALNQRFLLHGEHLDLLDALDELKAIFKPKGYVWYWFKVPLRLARFASRFNREMQALVRLLGPGDGRYRRVDGTKAARVLGFEYRDARQSIRETLESFRSMGLI